jgi:2-(acetamidomethylene)succinate hydrolase
MIELAGARTVECDLGGISLHGVAAGSGPLALLGHGITANGYVFLPLMARLADRFALVSFDQRGHGRSGKPPGGYAAQDFAADIAAAVRVLGGGPVLLIGHSLGARNALEAGVRYPDLVAGVVAIEFTPFIEPEVFDALAARVGGGDRVFERFESVKAYLADRYPRLPPDAVERRAKYGYVEADGGWRALADAAAMRQTAQGLRADLEPALRAIRVPTLLIRGADSRLVSPAAWAKTKALRPDLPAIEVAGGDHYAPEEVHGPIADEIGRFWGSLNSKGR